MNPTIGPLPADEPPPSAKDGLYAVHSLMADFSRQIHLALGGKGVAWASIAGLIGALCCAVSLIVVALSLDSDRVEEAQETVAKYALADQTFRDFMRAVHAAGLGTVPPPNGRLSVQEGWQRSNATLDAMCVPGHSDAPAELTRLCAALPSIRQRLGPSIEAYDPSVSTLPAPTIDELLALSRQINGLVTQGVRGTGDLIRTMSDQFAWAILVLTVSTAGFAGAGTILIVLVGRASMLHHEQWQSAVASANKANRLARQLEKQIVKTEQGRLEYQSLVDSLSDLIVRIDAETGVITFASAASLALWNVPPDRLVGTPIINHVAKEDRESVQAIVQSSLKGPDGRSMNLQHRAYDGNGRERRVEARFHKARGPNGRTIITGVIRDIEKPVQLVEQLARQDAQLRSIVESTGALIVLLDPDMRIVMVNGTFTTMVGIDGQDAVGRMLKEIVDCQLDKESLEAWRNGTSIKPIRFNNRLCDRQGREREISCTATPIVDSQGRLSNVVLLGIDDTDRLEAEQALFDSQRYATLGEMAATVAHELAQPLQVINIACSAVLDELAAAPNAVLDRTFLDQRIKRIAIQTERAGGIIGELRTFVRGTSQDAPGILDVSAAVRAAVDLVRHGLAGPGTKVAVSLADDLPMMHGHASRLEQVLVNLLNNARDAGARKIDVVASAAPSETSPNIVILVEDDGPGIPVEILPLLFNRFITTKPRGAGTGLGLRICRRIVEDMGGSITAANRQQGGARFEIVLPTAHDSNDSQRKGDLS